MPKFSKTLNRYIERDNVTVKASGAETASTDGAAIEVGDISVLNLLLNVTAATAPTSLDVKIQGSDDGSTNWYDLGSFTQRTAASQSERKTFAVGTRFIRYSSTIVGTSFTYAITGEKA